MLTRKPAVLFAACGDLISSSGSSVQRSCTSSRQDTRRHGQQRNKPAHDILNRRRRFATIANDNPQHAVPVHSTQIHVWPKAPKNHLHPTPYQILSTTAKTTYTKTRFYELVKIYHPDRTHDATASLPHAVKMERYRLVVAAHTILSDPSRRDAYDRFGAGWNGRAELGRTSTWHQHSPNSRPGPFSHSWQQSSDPIWQNATWEDWERFYARRAREAGGGGSDGATSAGTAAASPRSEGQYLQNSYFVVLVALLALVGSTANYTRAKDAGTYFVAQRDIVHDKTAKDLRRVRQEASLGDRDERIEWFVRNREAALGNTSPEDALAVREDRTNRLLPAREACRSDEIAGKGD